MNPRASATVVSCFWPLTVTNLLIMTSQGFSGSLAVGRYTISLSGAVLSAVGPCRREFVATVLTSPFPEKVVYLSNGCEISSELALMSCVNAEIGIDCEIGRAGGKGSKKAGA